MNGSAPPSSHRTLIDGVVCFLGLLAVGFCLFAVSRGFHHSLFEFYGFRQAQTAISVDAMLQGGPLLRYQTPVVGPPWSIPFEFPLYQWIVAACVRLSSAPLEETGRLVSIVFYFLCFLPLASILTRLGFVGTQKIPALALFAVSPLYVFGSRLFMIESTALFLSLLYTQQMFALVLGEMRWQSRHMAGAALIGVLAGLVKVTTLAPFFVLGSCLAAWGLWQGRKQSRMRPEVIGAVAVFCVALPVVATWSWTHFADAVKAENPIGVFLTSKALSTWNFGTLGERLHPRLYLQLFLGAANHVGSVWAALVVLGVYGWLCRRWNSIAATCVALYIGAMLLFFNLHVVHEYYSYANAVFLVVGTGVLIAAVLRLPGLTAWVGVALLAFVMGVCADRYLRHFYPLQVRNVPGRAQAAALIDQTTRPGEIILVEGLDWSAEFPYQSHRRAIMDATFDPKSHPWSLGPVEAAINNAHPEQIGALVACGDGRDKTYLPLLLQMVGMGTLTNLHADDCDIYERSVPGR